MFDQEKCILWLQGKTSGYKSIRFQQGRAGGGGTGNWRSP